MLRHAWALVAVVLVAGPILAQAPTSDQLRPAELKPVHDRLDQLDQAIKKIDEKLTRLVELNASNTQKEVADLREMVSALRREVADMASRSAKESSVSRKPTESQTGTVMLVNEHPVYPMTVVVNTQSFELPPNTRQPVTVPAGALVVQVLQTDPQVRTRSIQPGETKTFTMK